MRSIYTIKKKVLFVHDVCAIVLIALLCSLCVPQVAYAYVDPSVMTYTIQALAGVAVALSALAGVAFRRSRRFLMRALGIDENARKEVEPEVRRVDPETASFINNNTPAVKGRVEKSGSKEKNEHHQKWLWRLGLSFVVSVFFVVTVYTMPSYETLAGNQTSLVFGLKDVWQPIAVATCIAVVVLTLVISLLKGRVFNVVLAALFAFGLCCYLQAMFLNGGIPVTDGREIDWREHRFTAIWTLAIWAVVIGAALWAGVKHRRIATGVITVLSASLILVQGVAIGSFFSDMAIADEKQNAADAVAANDYRITDKGLFTVSPNSNVIVFVLDTYDTTDMMQVMRDMPEVKDRLAGFTWFKNSVGSMSPTRYGAPYLWTGIYPEADQPLEEFIVDRFKKNTFLDDLGDAGYSIGLYTDTIGDMLLTDEERRNLIYDKTINIKAPESGSVLLVDTKGILKTTLLCSLYRNLPWFAKPFFYYTTDGMNQSMVVERYVGDSEVEAPYVMDDALWYESLKQRGLSFEEGSNGVGAYRYIHLDGTHGPYVLDEYGGKPGTLTTVEKQACGSMRMVLDYIDELKRLDAFDNSTIIITADHGIWFESYPGPLPWLSSALMLVKPANQPDNQELQVSNAEIIAHDIFPTIIEAIGGDSQKYGGASIFDQNEVGRDRRYVLTHCVSGVDQILVEYKITGDVLEWDSWAESGVTWDPQNTPQP